MGDADTGKQRKTVSPADAGRQIIEGLEKGAFRVLIGGPDCSAPYVAMARAADRPVTFWLIDKAQHFDAFLAFPDYGQRYVPFLPKVHAALDAVWAKLDDPAMAIPQSPH